MSWYVHIWYPQFSTVAFCHRGLTFGSTSVMHWMHSCRRIPNLFSYWNLYLQGIPHVSFPEARYDSTGQQQIQNHRLSQFRHKHLPEQPWVKGASGQVCPTVGIHIWLDLSKRLQPLQNHSTIWHHNFGKKWRLATSHSPASPQRLISYWPEVGAGELRPSLYQLYTVLNWLTAFQPLWKIWVSWDSRSQCSSMFPIYGKKKTCSKHHIYWERCMFS